MVQGRKPREVLRRRAHDGVLLRLIDKWLYAGVLEDGSVSYPDAGTPQGAVISPMLANIFLHDLLDAWFDREVKPRLAVKAVLFRYADDAVLLFANETDARWVPERLGKYGLELLSSASNARMGRGSPRQDSTNPVRSGAQYRVGEARWPGMPTRKGRSMQKRPYVDEFRTALMAPAA